MYTATQNLVYDHVNILRIAAVMEKMIQNCEGNTENLELVINLIQSFADGFHHAKEEDILFPLMVKRGLSYEEGPISLMLQDHKMTRMFVIGMKKGIALIKAGNLSALPDLYSDMQGYINILRIHIGRENNLLFKMADKVFTPEDQTDMLLKFELIENVKYGEGELRQFLNDIVKLETVYEEIN